MRKEVIYVRLNILRKQTLSDRRDNDICGRRCGRFHIDVGRGKVGSSGRIMLSVLMMLMMMMQQ